MKLISRLTHWLTDWTAPNTRLRRRYQPFGPLGHSPSARLRSSGVYPALDAGAGQASSGHSPTANGFTLIELLTVIAIIGILTTVVSVNVSSSRQQARDARRKSDIKAMQTALELYYNANGKFPELAWGTNSNKSTWTSLQTALGSYLSSVPVDPVNNALEPWAAGALSYGYASAAWRGCTAGQWYVLVYGLENTKDTAIANSPGVRMCDGSVYNETSKGNIIVVGQGQ